MIVFNKGVNKMYVEGRMTVERANDYIQENREKVNPRYRPAFHVAPPVGWMNDPNGFVYYQGEYHLFYQFYPYNSQWGPMHWGHAKSKDLIHWEELPVALAPDEWYDKDGCFSGSAIEKDGRLYLMYTGHVVEDDVVTQTQCIAVSDDGITFEKLASNPVIGAELLGDEGSIHDCRDPKVIQHDGRYYSVLATKTPDNRGKILLFASDDLIQWSFFSVLLEGTATQGVMWECPDLFHLDGKDVLIMSPIQIQRDAHEYHNTSSTMAWIGEMDWESGTFLVENSHEMDYGMDYYAPQTLLDDQGRRILIAWMQMWERTYPTHELGHNWTGEMCLPRELSINHNRLVQLPVSEIYDYLTDQQVVENIEVIKEPVSFPDVVTENVYLKIVADLSQAQKLTMAFAKKEHQSLFMTYDKETALFSFSRENFGYAITGIEKEQVHTREFPVALIQDQLIIEIFRDTNAIEIFVNGQETCTSTFYEMEASSELVFESQGKALITSFKSAQVNTACESKQ